MVTRIDSQAGPRVGDSLFQDLKRSVQALEPHARLTSERRLAQQYGASHSTVRRVMNRLRDEGLVYKVHGGGCFVADLSADTQTLQTVVYVDTEVGSVGHPFFARRLAGMLDTCEACGFRLQIVRYRDARATEANAGLLQELERQEVVGAVLPWMGIGILNQLRATSPALRVVTTATRYPPPGVAAVFPDYSALGYLAAQFAAGSGAEAMTLLYHQHDAAAGAQAYAASRHHAHGPLAVLPLLAPLGSDPRALAEQVVAAGHPFLAADDSQTTRAVMAALAEHHAAFAAGCRWVSQANLGDPDLPAGIARLETDGYPFGQRLIERLHQLLQRGTTHPQVDLIGPLLRKPDAPARG